MSLVTTGTVSRVIVREPEGNRTWTERTLVIEDWGQTDYVTSTRELTAELELEKGQAAIDAVVGKHVAIVTAVGRPFLGRDGTAKAGGLMGLRLHPQLTEALNQKVRAAS